MNKQEIIKLKKQFKKDNPNLQLDKIYHFLVKKDGEVAFISGAQFQRIEDEEEQKILLNNFKKILNDDLDIKSFELSLKDETKKNELKQIQEEFTTESLEKIINRIAAKCNYAKDVNITVATGTYVEIPKSTTSKKKGRKSKAEKEMEESCKAEDTSINYKYQFFIVTVNLIIPVKKSLNLDYKSQTITGTNSTTRTINFAAPVEGFVYPLYTNQTEDSNGVLYYTKKKGEPNATFVYDVLGGELEMTQEEQTGCFRSLLSELYEDNPISLSALSGIYDELIEMRKDYDAQDEKDEPLTVSPGELKHIFERNNVPNLRKIEEFCQANMVDQQFKVENILAGPTSKISGENWSISIHNQHISRTISIEKDKEGIPYLKVELRDNPLLDGITVK